MLSALLYLSACSIRNRIRARLRRLRQPRYLIGSIAGLLYLYVFVFRHAVPRGVGFGVLSALDRAHDSVAFLGALLLFVVAAGAWVIPGAGRPIEFTRAEAQWLFQAPLTRRQLLHFKLLRGQLGAFFGTAVATLFLRPASFAEGWTFLAGTWILLAVIRLHFTGVALRRQSLAQHGAAGALRQWLPLAVVGAAVAVLLGTVARDWPALSRMATGGEVFEEVRRLAGQGAPSVVLWPFTALLTLPISRSAHDFLRALPPVAGLVILNYWWALRGDIAFEEASAVHAERRLAATQQQGVVLRGAVRREPFRLGDTGRPEVAILWKNLILLGRFASVRVLIRFVPLLILGAILGTRLGSAAGVWSVLSAACIVGAILTAIVGPQTMRQDLRQDLGSLAVLKSWPVRGSVVVRGEVFAPVIVLTVITWLLILGSAIFASPHGYPTFGPRPGMNTFAAELAIGCALLAPAVIGTQLVLHNGLAILFPAWVTVGVSRSRGVDAIGQRLLMMAGVVLTLGLALVPATVVAAGVAFVVYTVSPASVPLLVIAPAFTASVVMLAECWAATEALGRVFDRTDVTAVEVAE